MIRTERLPHSTESNALAPGRVSLLRTSAARRGRGRADAPTAVMPPARWPLEVSLEPRSGQPRDLLERTGLLEQMRRAGYDRQLGGHVQPALGLAVELEHELVPAADDQQHRCAHLCQRVGGQVWTAATRDDRTDLLPELGRGRQRRGRARARPEEADREARQVGLRPRPARRRHQPLRQQGDVEHVRAIALLLLPQQVEQQAWPGHAR